MKGLEDGAVEGGRGQETFSYVQIALKSPDVSNLLPISVLVSHVSPDLSQTPF